MLIYGDVTAFLERKMTSHGLPLHWYKSALNASFNTQKQIELCFKSELSKTNC